MEWNTVERAIRQEQTHEQNKKEWESSVGLCQRHKPQHPHHVKSAQERSLAIRDTDRHLAFLLRVLNMAFYIIITVIIIIIMQADCIPDRSLAIKVTSTLHFHWSYSIWSSPPPPALLVPSLSSHRKWLCSRKITYKKQYWSQLYFFAEVIRYGFLHHYHCRHHHHHHYCHNASGLN